MPKRIPYVAAKERDAAIREKDYEIKERDALRKCVAALKAKKKAESAKRDEAILSPTFDGFMYHEYVNGIRESCAFLKDNVAQELLESIDKAILKNEITRKRTLKRA
ncbi:hypothetical protein ACOSP7_019441 [Xanthoceras sorbifolium]